MYTSFLAHGTIHLQFLVNKYIDWGIHISDIYIHEFLCIDSYQLFDMGTYMAMLAREYKILLSGYSVYRRGRKEAT